MEDRSVCSLSHGYYPLSMQKNVISPGIQGKRERRLVKIWIAIQFVEKYINGLIQRNWGKKLLFVNMDITNIIYNVPLRY